MVPSEPPNWCPRCGAAYERLQEYCLECGERLPRGRALIGLLAAAWQRRLPWYPGDWIWPVVLFFVLTVVSTAAAVAAASTKSSPTLVATQPGVTVGPGETTTTTPTATLPPAPQPTITTGPLPTAPGNTPPPTTAPVTPTTTAPAPTTTSRATAAGSWPAGKNGYTNILESIPVSAGRARAEARARAAAAAGLPQTGVLDSNRYSSLHNGYYVVFSGVYSTAAQAAAALASAHARGFPNAYEARVTQ